MSIFTLTIFGITGNLSQIKLLPALYDMAQKNLLPDISIIGIARKEMDNNAFKKYIYDSLTLQNRHHKHPIDKNIVEKLCKDFRYIRGDVDKPNLYPLLKKHFKKTGTNNNVIYYLATYPDLYDAIFKNLASHKMNRHKNGWVRLMIEKPLGTDLSSAKKLNLLLSEYFSEEQIFRIDHYLGKETIQNILTFRFGNGLFEPLMNKGYIDHIQVTALEDFGIGTRGGYYDSVGALRDVGQNHLLQMLAFATMDAPNEFSNPEITKKRLEILKSLVPAKKAVFGQYETYQNEQNVIGNSQTDTFFAFKTYIHNKRFEGIPVYIRAGKQMKETVTEISIIFKVPINRLFKHIHLGNQPNVLIYRIQPNEGIILKILGKKPGHEIALSPEYMEFCYRNLLPHKLPDPYERLLSDAIRGDQTFFNDAAEVEAQWRFIDPLLANRSAPAIYKEGSWGPKTADDLIEKDGRSWLIPSPQYCRI